MRDSMVRHREPSAGIDLHMKLEARRMANQHRKLSLLRDEIQRSLSARSLRRAEAAFERFSEMLESHFEVEERVHFAALRTNWPALDGIIGDLETDHERIRSQVARVRASFTGGNGFESAITLGRLLEQIVRHEAVEESVMRRPSGTRGPGRAKSAAASVHQG